MRVTERAQNVVHQAKGEAGRLGHDRVGTQHLLLGLLTDHQCLAAVTLRELEIRPETVRQRVEETVGRGQGQDVMGLYLPMTKPATLILGLAGREATRLEADRVGTEHLLLGLASEGEGVAARVLQELGAGLLELREAVAARYAAGVEPEPLPPDRGPPPWEPPPGAQLRRVIPLAQRYPLPMGDQLVLLSLEIWSDWFDLRYAVVYATPEPEGELPRRAVLGACEVSDRAGTAYTSPFSSSPSYGIVRVHQRTFVPSPPPDAEALELRFRVPTWSEEAQVATTVDLP
ncbi:MAG TPA: Clp protease N-terminal domain-containing protein [Actinomycetes bacterium]